MFKFFFSYAPESTLQWYLIGQLFLIYPTTKITLSLTLTHQSNTIIAGQAMTGNN